MLQPSAFARFPGGVTIARNYGILEVRKERETLPEVTLSVPGTVIWGEYRITACMEAGEGMILHPVGRIRIRARQSGDTIRLTGGTKSLKKLFIDRKIPASRRDSIPVLCDEAGILAVHGIGINQDRTAEDAAPVRIQIEETEKSMEEK